MFLNFTFFAQVINFFITYWFCKRFFFAPLVKQIFAKRQVAKQIQAECAATKQKLIELEKQKNQLLREFQIKNLAKQKQLPTVKETSLEEELIPSLEYDQATLINVAKTMIKNKASL